LGRASCSDPDRGRWPGKEGPGTPQRQAIDQGKTEKKKGDSFLCQQKMGRFPQGKLGSGWGGETPKGKGKKKCI